MVPLIRLASVVQLYMLGGYCQYKLAYIVIGLACVVIGTYGEMSRQQGEKEKEVDTGDTELLESGDQNSDVGAKGKLEKTTTYPVNILSSQSYNRPGFICKALQIANLLPILKPH